MEKILFAGYYGRKNTGDDAFCVVANWGSRKFWGASDISFLASELPQMDPFPKMILSDKNKFRSQNFIKGVVAALKADKIVFFGGSLFHGREKLLGIKNILCNIPRFSRKKLLGLGISLGPFKNKADYQYNQEILKNFSVLVFRDKESCNIAKEMNLDVRIVEAADPALLLPDVLGDSFEAVRSSKRGNLIPVLGISLCHYERYVGGDVEKESQRESAIFEALKSLERKMNLKFRFFIFNGHPVCGDEDVTVSAIKFIQPRQYEVIPYIPNVIDVMRRMGECNAFLGARLHAIIFSYILRVPFLSVEYHRKCVDFLKMIEFNNEFRLINDAFNIAQNLEYILKENASLFVNKKDDLRIKALDNFIYA